MQLQILTALLTAAACGILYHALTVRLAQRSRRPVTTLLSHPTACLRGLPRLARRRHLRLPALTADDHL